MIYGITGPSGSGKITIARQAAEIERLREALAPLAAIADAFDENELDDEARKHWSYGTNETPHDQIELYQGRGGKQLLTLADAMRARAALTPEASHDR